jgi:hypothetical protein
VVAEPVQNHDPKGNRPRASRSHWGVGGFLGRGIVLVSLLAVLAPLPRYVRRLDPDDLLLWVAAVAWVVGLPVVFWIVLRAARGWLARPKSTRS